MQQPNYTWAITFVSVTLASSRRFRDFAFATVCTHECLAIKVAHSLPNVGLIAALTQLIATHVEPIRRSLHNGNRKLPLIGHSQS